MNFLKKCFILLRFVLMTIYICGTEKSSDPILFQFFDFWSNKNWNMYWTFLSSVIFTWYWVAAGGEPSILQTAVACWAILPQNIKNKVNWRAHIRHQCRKTTVLNCHRCLINTVLKKWAAFKYRLDLWPPDVST